MASGRGRYLDRGRTTLALARCRPEWLRSRRLDPAPKRDSRAAQRLMKKLLKSAGTPPRVMITDKLRSYGAARAKMGFHVEHRQHKALNNRAENSHQPTRRRERIMKRLKSSPSGSTVSVSSRSGREPFPHPLSRSRHGRLPSSFAPTSLCDLARDLQDKRYRRLSTSETRLLQLGDRLVDDACDGPRLHRAWPHGCANGAEPAKG
ncbi:putative transposase [Bradyrhizobium daqingense]|uniref:Putative transposase n=1 Tax=Bradyrhizobium daqingense TaxID=993502 RepID=A0A562K896_9BRAD|nr:putative transposase [Bradyrhizobium daqingense]